MNDRDPFSSAQPRRRQLLRSGAAAVALSTVGATTALAAAAGGAVQPEAKRSASRARFKLSKDFSVPSYVFAVVPWDVTEFQTGTDYTLEPDGRILINRSGLYQIVFSCDWDATYGTDIDLRKIGIRWQKRGQPAEPTTGHERLGFIDIPASDPPRMARYQGAWDPEVIPVGQVVSVDVIVSPPGIVGAGDVAQASHTQIRESALSDQALSALQVHAKVISANKVRVSLYNPTVEAGIEIPPGTLKVLAMNAVGTRGTSGDAWAVLHSPSTELNAGDRVYGMMEHKVEGTLLQSTRSSYMQIDRL